MSEQKLEGLGQSMLGAIPPIADMPEPCRSAVPGQSGEVFFQSYSPCDFYSVIHSPHDTPTTCVGELHLPKGSDTKVPAIVFLPGSGGYVENDRRTKWANWFLSMGRAVLFVDHYRPRGIDADKDYGISLLAISLFDRVADAYGALNLLHHHPDIHASNIALMGLSLGGATTRFALDDRFREAYAADTQGFSGFIDFYGPCTESVGTEKTNGSPLLTVRGTNDASNHLETCSKEIKSYRELGVAVTERIYKGAPHGWDATHEPVLLEHAPYIVGCNTTYDKNGIPHYKGIAQPVAGIGANRLKKIKSRLVTMGASSGDLRFGYLNGHNESAAAAAEFDLETFLESLS